MDGGFLVIAGSFPGNDLAIQIELTSNAAVPTRRKAEIIYRTWEYFSWRAAINGIARGLESPSSPPRRMPQQIPRETRALAGT